MEYQSPFSDINVPPVVRGSFSADDDYRLKLYFSKMREIAEKEPGLLIVGTIRPNKHGVFFVIDTEDGTELIDKAITFRFTGGRYYPAFRPKGSSKTTLWSRYFLDLGATDKNVADHIDSHTINASRGNLRSISARENHQHLAKRKGKWSSDFHGVHFSHRHEKYIAKVTVDGKRKNLGYFSSEEKAAKARDLAVVQAGLHSKLNYPENRETYLAVHKLVAEKKIYGVKKCRTKYYPHIRQSKKYTMVGGKGFSDIEDAKRVYDLYVVENNLDAPLNFPEEHPNFCPPKILPRARKTRPFDAESLEVLATQGKWIIMDKDVYEPLKYCKFYNNASGGYPQVKIDEKIWLLHLYIMRDQVRENMVVDHINGNRWDARSSNLRMVSQQQNASNRKKSSKATTSRFMGVCQQTKGGRWCCSIQKDLGYIFREFYETEELAARARDLYLIDHPELFQRKNFDDWGPPMISKWRGATKKIVKGSSVYHGISLREKSQEWYFRIKYVDEFGRRGNISAFAKAELACARMREIAILSLPCNYKVTSRRNFIPLPDTVAKWKIKYNFAGFVL